MNRRRRLFTPAVLLRMQEFAYGGDVIPPRSIVRLNARWRDNQGRIFRIGYYHRKDGLDCVWLVNERGEYEQTTSQRSIREDCTVLELSDETDLFGIARQPLAPSATPPQSS